VEGVAMSGEAYVIWTRYWKPGRKVVVRHAYGPFPTRAKAETVKKRILRTHEVMYGTYKGEQIEVAVVKLLDPTPWPAEVSL
jgi:hypothetical protein